MSPEREVADLVDDQLVALEPSQLVFSGECARLIQESEKACKLEALEAAGLTSFDMRLNYLCGWRAVVKGESPSGIETKDKHPEIHRRSTPIWLRVGSV